MLLVDEHVLVLRDNGKCYVTKGGVIVIVLLLLGQVNFRHDSDDVIGCVLYHFLGQRSFCPVVPFRFVPLCLKIETLSSYTQRHLVIFV